MKFLTVFNLAFSLGVFALMTATAQSQELYKWVDAEGVTHYGDSLPEQSVAHQSFKFTPYEQVAVESDYYSIQNQLKRLQERRAAELKQKQQRAEINALKVPAQPEVVITPQPEQKYYAPAYFPHAQPFGFKKHRYYTHHKHAKTPKAFVEPRAKRGLVVNGSSKVNKSSTNKATFSATK